MFLTRFRVNTARRSARKLLSSPQAMHAAVLAGFVDPPRQPPGGPRTLWRVDADGSAGRILYIVSPTEPDLTHLVEQAGWPTTATWETRNYTGLLESLRDGQRWAFRLTANPTRNGRKPGARDTQNPDSNDTQRFGHVTVEQQRTWLLDRSERCGFRVLPAESGEPDLVVHGRGTQTFLRNRRRVTLRMVTYDGQLEVADAEALRRALTTGIGHAKAYGCGLLTLAPMDRS